MNFHFHELHTYALRVAGFAEHYASDSAMNAGGKQLIAKLRAVAAKCFPAVNESKTPAGVLAVMDQLVALAADDCLPEPRDPDTSDYDEWERQVSLLASAREARAAVAELIAAAKRLDHEIEHGGHFSVADARTRLQAALARIGGAA